MNRARNVSATLFAAQETRQDDFRARHAAQRSRRASGVGSRGQARGAGQRRLQSGDCNQRLGAALFTKPVSINFPSNGVQLSPEALAVVNEQILPQLEIAGGMSVRVEGNTDGIGERSANQAPSEKRAGAIVEKAVAHLRGRLAEPSLVEVAPELDTALAEVGSAEALELTVDEIFDGPAPAATP
jgi:outer membrane protein OmpA-like peptidoglycan-associated protein